MKKNKLFYKNIKKLCFFLAFGLILQLTVLFIIDQFVLGKRDIATSMKFKEVVDNSMKSKIPDPIPLPSNVKDIQLSYNAKYISYIDDGELKIVNTANNTTKTIDIPSNLSISRCRWIPNIERIYISVKKDTLKNTIFTFYYYDAKKDELNKVQNENKKDVKIIYNKNSKVKDMKISNLTGMNLIKLENSYSRNSLFTLNRMNEEKKVKIPDDNIKDIELMLNTDTIIYEKLPSNTINCVFKNNQIKKLNVHGLKNPSLITTDKDGIIYIASLKNKKTNTIYHRSLDDTVWKKTSLPFSVDKNSIYVINKDNIYINDSSNNTLTEIHSNVSKTYKGTLIGVYNNKMASIYNSKVIIDKLK